MVQAAIPVRACDLDRQAVFFHQGHQELGPVIVGAACEGYVPLALCVGPSGGRGEVLLGVEAELELDVWEVPSLVADNVGLAEEAAEVEEPVNAVELQPTAV